MTQESFRILEKACAMTGMFPHGEAYFYTDTLMLKWKQGEMTGQVSWKSKETCVFLRKLHSQNQIKEAWDIVKMSVSSAAPLMSTEVSNAPNNN